MYNKALGITVNVHLSLIIVKQSASANIKTSGKTGDDAILILVCFCLIPWPDLSHTSILYYWTRQSSVTSKPDYVKILINERRHFVKAERHFTTVISFFFDLTFSLISLLAGLAPSRIPQHSQNTLEGVNIVLEIFCIYAFYIWDAGAAMKQRWYHAMSFLPAALSLGPCIKC